MVAGTGISLSIDVNGHKVITSTASAPVFYNETPTGTIDGMNKTFTTAHSINYMIGLYMNGQYIHPASYTFSGTTITFGTAPDISFAGLPFTVVYN